ncbi:MAG: hypothetical protein K8R60_03790 [Burkholderiales bacterium]|nr:hypothetical protein [Burkholderiales bacterium]
MARPLVALLAGIGIGACAPPAVAQEPPTLTISGAKLQKRANGVLALMGYSVVPDLVSSSLSIDNAGTQNPAISLSQLAGGFTWSRATPLYLEGGVAYSRYDPSFIASNGEEQRAVPVKWVSGSLTTGVGWDFPVMPDLVLRPIFNFAYGRVTSDLTLAAEYLDWVKGVEIDFLDRGHLEAYGIGGSLMLDYERVRPDHEIDVEVRYTAIRLQSVAHSSAVFKGHADAVTASLWSRYRAPTGFTALERPVRYVLEYAYTRYLGDQAGILGFNYLNSVGAGLELDSSARDLFITRTRLVGRYMFGKDVSGFSVGLAVSF